MKTSYVSRYLVTAVSCTRCTVVMGDPGLILVGSLCKRCVVWFRGPVRLYLLSNFECLLLPWLPHSLPDWPPTTYSGKQWGRRSACQHLPDTQPSVFAQSIFLLQVWNSEPAVSLDVLIFFLQQTPLIVASLCCVSVLPLQQKISIPRPEKSSQLQTFTFYLSNVGRDNPQGSFDCIQQYITRWNKLVYLRQRIELNIAC